MDPRYDRHVLQSRRSFLTNTGMGLGTAALTSLIPRIGSASEDAMNRLRVPGAHFAPRAKRVIFLFMAGAPSQLDLFDYKPDLQKQFNEKLPESVSRGQRVTAMTRGSEKRVAPSKFKFAQHGKSGVWMSELLPHLTRHADKLCFVHSMNTEAINHDPGKTSFCTGSEIPGKASMGAWLSYGLGSMNKDLPDYVVMPSAKWSGKVNVQALYARLWGSGFLRRSFKGRVFKRRAILFCFCRIPGRRCQNSTSDARLVGRAESKHFVEIGDPEIQTTIAQQEMAFRMQSSVPELTDISSESPETLAMYGPDVDQPGSFARNCLLARRMAERDVRFIQLFHRGWDHHSNLPDNMTGQCRDVDQPVAALLQDLNSVDCWMIRLLCSVVSLAGPFMAKVNLLWITTGETIIRGVLRRGLPVAESKVECITARQMTSVTTWSKTQCMFVIFTQRCCTCYASTTPGLTFQFQGLDQKLTGLSTPMS